MWLILIKQGLWDTLYLLYLPRGGVLKKCNIAEKMLYKSEEKNVGALQKPYSEGCIKSDHLLKISGWSDVT